jgi:hypothetical protein
MKERGMLFSPPMVRALLDGSKTQTRRVVKHSPAPWNSEHIAWDMCRCPYGQPGDRLWVREAFRHIDFTHIDGIYSCATQYEADKAIGKRKSGGIEIMDFRIGLRPSIHMPRWASRIDLEITGVRVEQLQDCSEANAIAEGIHSEPYVWRDCEYPLPDVAYRATQDATRRFSSPRDAYRDLWESINGPGSWDANPWVWVIEFRRVQP